MDNFDSEQPAEPNASPAEQGDEDEGIDYTDIPRITDFSGAKRVRDYGSAAEVMRVLYREKLDRAAKVAAGREGTESYTERTFNKNHPNYNFAELVRDRMKSGDWTEEELVLTIKNTWLGGDDLRYEDVQRAVRGLLKST